MLEHETEVSSAALTRVSAEELTRALAAIESRRQSGLERDMDTIALGEAVRQLALDLTPDELLAEIRAQREADRVAAAAEASSQKTEEEVSFAWRGGRRGSRRSLLVPGIIAFLVLYVMFVSSLPYYSREPFVMLPILACPVVLYTWLVAWASSPHGGGGGRRLLFRQPLTVGDAVAWDKPVCVSLSTVLRIARGMPPSSARIDDGGSRRWEVVSLYDKPAVRGWTDGLVREGKLRVLSARPVGRRSAVAKYRPITVAMSRFVGVPDPPEVVQSPLYEHGIEEVEVPAE